jgi:elongation factor P hydroxylase
MQQDNVIIYGRLKKKYIFLTLISYTVSMLHLSSDRMFPIEYVVNSNVTYRVIKYAHTYYSSNILFIIFTVIITKVKSTIIELELPH